MIPEVFSCQGRYFQSAFVHAWRYCHVEIEKELRNKGTVATLLGIILSNI